MAAGGVEDTNLERDASRAISMPGLRLLRTGAINMECGKWVCAVAVSVVRGRTFDESYEERWTMDTAAYRGGWKLDRLRRQAADTVHD